MNKILDNLDLEIKNIDSVIKSHNINNCDFNRSIRFWVVRLIDLLGLLYSCAWITQLDYNRYCRLIDNRLKIIDSAYYIKENN